RARSGRTRSRSSSAGRDETSVSEGHPNTTSRSGSISELEPHVRQIAPPSMSCRCDRARTRIPGPPSVAGRGSSPLGIVSSVSERVRRRANEVHREKRSDFRLSLPPAKRTRRTGRHHARELGLLDRWSDAEPLPDTLAGSPCALVRRNEVLEANA